MRDIQILEEWLTKVRQQKLNDVQRLLLGASSGEDLQGARCLAVGAELLRQVIEGVRLLGKDPTEFVKRNLG